MDKAAWKAVVHGVAKDLDMTKRVTYKILMFKVTSTGN